MQACSGINTFRGVEEAGLGRGEVESHSNCLESFSPSGTSGTGLALQTCPELGLRASPLYPCVSQSLESSHRCPEKGVCS